MSKNSINTKDNITTGDNDELKSMIKFLVETNL